MSAPPFRLLFLMNEALFFTTHRLPIALEAQARGVEVHVAAPFDAAPVEKIRSLGFTYHDIPLARGGRNPLGDLRLLWRFVGLIRRLRPDLVHHVAMKPVVWGGLASRLLGVPAVVHAITGLGFLFIRQTVSARIMRGLLIPLYRFALHHPNARAIFQNPDDLGLFTTNAMVPGGIVDMIRGCGVDLARYAPRPLPEAPPVRVVFPARLIADKGLREFVGAARILKAEGLSARFLLVGRRDPENPTDIAEAEIRGWEREGLVEWVGFSADMPAVFADAHIVCMPSYREGLPRVLIEAAACGRSIVTADVPGCREIVHDGDNGLLARVEDAEDTARALRALIVDPDLRTRMGRRGRERAETEFSVEQFVAQTLESYRRVATKGPFA